MSDNEKKSRGKDVLEDVKSLLKEEEGGGGSGGSDDYDDTMPRKKGGNAFVAIFLVALLVIIGFLGYVLVSEDARGKVAAFIRGDLFKIEKERAEDLQKLYQDKMEQMAEKFGDIRLEYFPRDAKVHIYQRLFRYASLKEQKAEAWGDFREIPNDTLTLAEGEELPFLSIENLPVRVRGQICARDGQFYPANQMFCPDLVDKCKTAMAQGQVSEECDKGKLLSVQYCPQDKLYYPDEGNMVLLCPDGKTLMEPTEVPIFVYHYDFLFERKDFISKAEHYEEGDWVSLGSGKYIVKFQRDYALQRAWEAVKAKYTEVRKKMRCWRLDWEDWWEDMKREKLLAAVHEKMAEDAKKKEEREAVLRTTRDKYIQAVTAVDVVRRVKLMATLRKNMAEIFYYCPSEGDCDVTKLKEVKDAWEDVYYAILYTMKIPEKRVPGTEAWIADKPLVKAGLTCLYKWIPVQKEGEFVELKAPECTAALEGIKGQDETAYLAFRAMFIDPAAGVALLKPFKDDAAKYVQSVVDYQGAEKYEDMTFRMEGSGRFLEYLILAALFDYQAMTETLIEYAKSRQVNYKRDCEQRQVIPSDPFKGLKAAMEIAWWSGSRLAFEDWYSRTWQQDVQGCLLFARDHDKARYERDMKKFGEFVDKERAVGVEQAKMLRDLLTSLRNLRAGREELKAANAMFARDKKAFFAKYTDAEIARIKGVNPDLALGLQYLTSKEARATIDGWGKLPPPAVEGEPAGKEGDQQYYHRYLAYMDVFSPAIAGKGFAALEARVQPMLMSQAEYDKLRETQPQLPPYTDALRDVVQNDIHFKYFYLLKLLESPTKFNQVFSKLEYREALEVARWIDPERYVYLVDLTWLKENPDRHADVVPVLSDALAADFGLYQAEFSKLQRWCETKSRLYKKYRRSKALVDSMLAEPTQAEKALEKALKMTNRFALLAKNLQDMEEAVVSTYMSNAMDDVRDAADLAQRESYANVVEKNNESLRLAAGFTKKEWESLTKEFEKNANSAEWYNALQENLDERRLDCRQVQYPEPQGWREKDKAAF